MTEIAQSIDLELSKKLSDPAYRKKFFLAEASARIAQQLIALRKRRGLNQKELAERIGTKQPAISRVERADYNNWSINTLRAIAEELDARIQIVIEPSEDILHEYGPVIGKISTGKTTDPSIVSGASYGVTLAKPAPAAVSSGEGPSLVAT